MNIGPYIVRLLQQPGHGCALYCVYLGSVKIGQCISMPSESDCKYLERQQREQTFYAYSSAPLQNLTGTRRANTGGAHPMARNRKVGAPRKSETLRDIAKQIAGG